MNGDFSLRWQAESDSAWRMLEPAPAENRGFQETRRYLLAKPFAGAELYVDDEPLLDYPGVAGCWIWKPGFFAGEVTAELTGPGGVLLAIYLLDVAPEPSKLGREIFSTMVRELLEADPGLLIGDEPAMTAIGEQGTATTPWLEFARLRAYGPDVLRMLPSIAARPRRTLRVRRDAVPARLVRRVDRTTALSLRHVPGLLATVVGSAEGHTRSSDPRLDVPCIEESLDSAANRAMLALLWSLLRRGASLMERLEPKAKSENNETRTSLLARWPRRRKFLMDFTQRLTWAMGKEPWTAVTRAEVSAAGLNAIAADPIYSRTWSRGWRALRPGVQDGEWSERLWMSPTWELYERWCFVRMAKMLGVALPGWGWTGNSCIWTGAREGCRITFELQPTFRAGPSDARERWSVSRQREPDLLLTVERAGEKRFLLLDAKYRSSRENVLDAMQSAHIYQDSLRIGMQRPEAALLLVPAPGGAPWLEDISFQQIHQVGIDALIPGEEREIPALVREFLDRWAGRGGK